MKKLLQSADRYIESMTWKDVALLKTCVAAVGFCAGMLLPEKKRKPALIIVIGIFAATYIPLLTKFIPFLRESFRRDNDDIDALLNEIDWDDDEGECLNMEDLRNAMLYDDETLFDDDNDSTYQDEETVETGMDTVETSVDEVVQESAEELEDGLQDEP